MPLENNPKQIPDITLITTPTAGQETDIELPVAKHSTYATSRMTLAQIFTLGSISGAIKSALDTLTTAVGVNSTAITNLGTTKLDKNAATRTGLTANRAIITDATGVETYLTGTTTQVIGFDGAGKPIAVTPSVDINGLTNKPTPIGADVLVLADSGAGFVNKKSLLSALFYPLYGKGTDGSVTVSTTITLTRDMHYTTLTVTGAGIINTNGYRIFYTISCVNDGIIQDLGANGAQGGDGANLFNAPGGVGGVGTGLYKKTGGLGGSTPVFAGGTPATSTLGITGVGGTGGTGGGNPGTNAGGSGSNVTNRIQPSIGIETISYVANIGNIKGDAGGGGGGGDTGGGTNGAGGGGGGGANAGYVGLYGPSPVTGTGSISVKGGNGGRGGNAFSAAGGGGGGGGGSGGVIDILPGYTNTTNILGGTGGIAGSSGTGNNATAGANGSNGVIIYH